MTGALTVGVVGSAGKKTGSVELSAEVSDAPLNIPLIHQMAVDQLAATRQGTHAARVRGDVRGDGRRPYHRKGIGRARQSLIRVPQFVSGGTVHGPQPRDYGQRALKKMKAAALCSALSDRTCNGRIHVITEFVITTVSSTKDALVTLRNPTDRKALVIVDRQDDLSRLSLRNTSEVHVLWADRLNTYGVLKSDDVVFTASGLDVFLDKGEKESR